MIIVRTEHHHQDHDHGLISLNRSFIVGIVINLAFVVAEFVAGFLSNSMGLLSDAGHNLSDATSLILALIAFKLTKVQANNRYTYGYKRSTILVSLLNAVILMVAVIIIIVESIDKFVEPQPVDGVLIIWVAAIGVLINGATAWLFVKDKERDLNVKGAYLHMAMDALVSVGVVFSGILILITGWTWIDAVVGLIIAIVIILSTWNLLKSSIRLALDGVPGSIDPEEIRQLMLGCEGVQDIHHLHIWALSTTENALTAHVVVHETAPIEALKAKIKRMLAEHQIGHATLEIEPADGVCVDFGGTDRSLDFGGD
jgi:cobalt-zinc-cadmium efflux system protein